MRPVICAGPGPASGQNRVPLQASPLDGAADAANLSNIFNPLGKFRGPAPRSLAKSASALQERPPGEMAEWLKAHAWKACVRETVPWVRIPLSPPELPNTQALCEVFGSIRRAFRVILQVTEKDRWDQVARARAKRLMTSFFRSASLEWSTRPV